MKNIEKFAVALIIAWTIQALATPALYVWVSKLLITEVSQGHGVSWITESLGYVGFAGLISSKLVCGFWLYSEAQRERQSKWVWCFLGFFGGVVGVIIFYLNVVVESVRAKARANQSTLQTPTSVTPAAGAPVAPPSVAAGL